MHTDHLGSVRAVTDEAGTVVWSADYLAFGTRFGEAGDGAFEQWKGFTGKEYDPETGLNYFNARWYDSELGRFISEDPARDPNNPNLYTYGRNNPLRFFDPTGLLTLGDIGLANPGRINYDPDIEIGGVSTPTPSISIPNIGVSLPVFKDPKEAERNIPGFEYDQYDIRLSLENQIQLHLIMTALEEQYRGEDGRIGFLDRIKLGLAREQLKTAFSWLNYKARWVDKASNLFGERIEKWGPYYASEQIDEALLEVGCFQAMAVVGAVGLYSGMKPI